MTDLEMKLMALETNLEMLVTQLNRSAELLTQADDILRLFIEAP